MDLPPKPHTWLTLVLGFFLFVFYPKKIHGWKVIDHFVYINSFGLSSQ